MSTKYLLIAQEIIREWRSNKDANRVTTENDLKLLCRLIAERVEKELSK